MLIPLKEGDRVKLCAVPECDLGEQFGTVLGVEEDGDVAMICIDKECRIEGDHDGLTEIVMDEFLSDILEVIK